MPCFLSYTYTHILTSGREPARRAHSKMPFRRARAYRWEAREQARSPRARKSTAGACSWEKESRDGAVMTDIKKTNNASAILISHGIIINKNNLTPTLTCALFFITHTQTTHILVVITNGTLGMMGWRNHAIWELAYLNPILLHVTESSGPCYLGSCMFRKCTFCCSIGLNLK